MSHPRSPLSLARRWTAGALLATTLGAGAIGVHLAADQGTTTASSDGTGSSSSSDDTSSSASTGASSGTSSDSGSSGFGSVSGVTSGGGQAQSSTSGS